MTWHPSALWRALRDLLCRKSLEQDLQDELQSHIESEAAWLAGRGMRPELARRAARQRLGSTDAVADAARAAWGGASLRGTWHYLGLGARALWRSPLFTCASLAMLTLCGAGLTMTGSLLYRAAFEPLPWPSLDRIVRVGEAHRRTGVGGSTTSIPNFLEWRAHAPDFERLAIAMGDVRLNLMHGDDAESVHAARVSDGWPEVFGQGAVLGRTFEPEDLRPGAPPVILLSHRLWHRVFGADPGIIGRPIHVNGLSPTVIGVLPPGFGEPGEATDAWLPTMLAGGMADNRWARAFTAAGRLRDGVSIEAARRNLEALSLTLEQEFPGPNTEQVARVTSWASAALGDLPRILGVLAGGAVLVLLIGGANVAYLAIVRLTRRADEFAVRIAFGAGTADLLRQLLAEHLLLVATGGLAGMLLGWAGLRALPALAADALPRAGLATFAAPVAFAILAALVLLAMAVTAAALGGARRMAPLDRIRGGPRSSATATETKGRYLFVSAQVASAFVLMLAAGLVLRSVRQLLQVDPGFDPAGVVTARLAPRGPAYARAGAFEDYATRIAASVAGIPGVIAVALADEAPQAGDGVGWTYVVEGLPAPEPGSEPTLMTHVAGPGYMAALGIPLVEGDLSRLDRGEADAVAVSERFARELPGGLPLGRRIKLGSAAADNPWLTIVAVVGDVRHGGLDQPAAPDIYQPVAAGGLGGTVTVITRFATDPAARLAELRQALRSVDPSIPPFDVRMLDEIVRTSVARSRFMLYLLESLAALAVVLAVSGVLGVQALAASQSQRAQAIRLALGARPWGVAHAVLRRGLSATLAGLAAGVLLGVAGGRVLQGLLYETRPADPGVLAAAVIGFAAVAVAANLVPVWMIVRTDPARVLREG